jgi:abortive infection bacteriophage resistance protein
VYDKPHLTYEAQLDRLISRRPTCTDPACCDQLAHDLWGYYRLSAYVYPFRVLLPADERQKESPTHYPADLIRRQRCGKQRR